MGDVSSRPPGTRVLLLGPVAVATGGQVAGVPQLAPRVLLATLAAANSVVAAGTLIDAIWQEEHSQRRLKNLHTHVYQLRRWLTSVGAGSRPPEIVTQPPGYRLVLADGDLDVSVFSQLVSQARDALRAGDYGGSAAGYRQALALWRGPALADVTEAAPRLRGLAGQLEEQRQTVLSERIAADLAAGLDVELLGELTGLVLRYPLRERLRYLLMLTLYRCGRQADALAAYHDARQTLREELGLDPGPELAQLHQRILAADAGLADPAAAQPARPAHPAGSAASLVPRQLPPAMTRFVGRTPELAALGLMQRQATANGTALLVVIAGSAGVGKSALAVRWAHEISDQCPHGQLYVNLRGFDPSCTPVQPEQAVRGFLAALDVPAERIPASLDAQVGLYRSLVAGKRVLVLLDNASDADQVRPLLPGGAGCVAVVTSRNELLGLAATDDAHILPLGVFSEAEAGELLRLRLPAEYASGPPLAAGELIELCARLPLALAIVLARADARRGLPLAGLVDELRVESARLDALDGGEETASVRNVFSWSYRSLSEPAAQMFRLVAMHPGPDVGLLAAASLANVSPALARARLDELIGSHLLAESTAGRFSFHDLLRVYAAERARDQHNVGGRRAVVHRALDYYLQTAHAAAAALNPARDPIPLPTPQPGVAAEPMGSVEQALSWCQAEHQVLLRIIDQAAAEGFDTHAWQLPWCLVNFFDRQACWPDWVSTQRIGLAAAERLGDRFGQANAHQYLGIVYVLLGQNADAHRELARALDLYAELGLPGARARGHLDLSRAHECDGQFGAALSEARKAMELYDLVGNRAGKARALNAVGWSYAHLGDAPGAIGYCQQALDLHQDLGNLLGQAAAWDSLGYASAQLGDHARAVACYRRALRLLVELGCQYQAAAVRIGLGSVHLASGDSAAAQDEWRQALDILERIRHPDADQVRVRLRNVTRH